MTERYGISSLDLGAKACVENAEQERDIVERLNRLNKPALLPGLQNGLTAAVAEIERLRATRDGLLAMLEEETLLVEETASADLILRRRHLIARARGETT